MLLDDLSVSCTYTQVFHYWLSEKVYAICFPDLSPLQELGEHLFLRFLMSSPPIKRLATL